MLEIYKILLKTYGPQGWWPIVKEECTYHLNAPNDEKERFEISVGAILTQNTQWDPNVVRAIKSLKDNGFLEPVKILGADDKTISKYIKSAGYHNQKTRKLKEFCKAVTTNPNREELLSIWGIGPETADSILLYAYTRPSFVVDAYTKRILSRIGFCEKSIDYHELQEMITNSIPKDLYIYKEFHALLVEHAKVHCRKTPECESCCLVNRCKTLINK